MKTLAIMASPLEKTEKGSASKAMLDLFLKNINGDIKIINLNEEKVGTTPLTSNNFSTFFTDGISDKFIEELKSVDHLVIAFPMINFGYPAVLKNFIDHVFVAKKTFQYKYDAKGASEGLLTNIKKVQLLMTQGADNGWYPFAGFGDTLEGMWKFVGVQKVEQFLLPATKVGENLEKSADEQISKYKEDIIKLANNF